jgi:hypothetical protein
MNPFAEELSTRWTYFYKYIFPALWIGGFASGTCVMWFQSLVNRAADPEIASMRWIFLLATIVGSTVIIWSSRRLKKVSMDGQFLYVSDFSNEIQVPLSAISKVTENRWDNSHPVTIYFSQPTDFGQKITFMPTIRMFGFWSSHPVVDKIRSAANISGDL